ncbi:MAG: hypothetical protein WCQ53_01870 [bacterium]
MKKLFSLLLTSTFIIALFGCGGTSSSPAPLAANDASYKGVYKGVLTGSTGHFWIDAYNTDATKILLTVTFTDVSLDNVQGTLTMDGSNYVYNFSSNGCVMAFEVTPVGVVVNSGTSLVCSGHAGTIAVVADKATSTVDVSVWEGTETNSGVICSQSGIWNVIIKGSKVAGTHFVTASDCGATGLAGNIVGTLTGDTISCTAADGDVTATGTVNGSSMSGNWTGLSLSGTFEGSKTL